jgi:flagellar basal body P-ring formation protein FlgA
VAGGVAVLLATAASSPTLRPAAVVTSELVRIGDLVENAGAVAEVAIFRAPDLGQTGSVPASSVAEAVRVHHIIGLATNGIDEVTVTRASRAITGEEIEARLVHALAGQHMPSSSTPSRARSMSKRTRSSASCGSPLIRARTVST